MRDGMILMWSTWLDEQICENIYDDDCLNDCNGEGCCYRYDNGGLDYDLMNNVIDDDLEMRFKENNYQYFLIGESCNWYGGYDGNKPKMKYRVSPLYDNIKDILYKQLGYCEDYRIYKGKYNSLWIEGSHHDGSELYQVCRLSKQGQKYYDLGYDFDWKYNSIKSVFKDFEKNF